MNPGAGAEVGADGGSGPGGRPPSTRAAAITAAARRLLEAEGADAVTMRRLAGEVGLRAPTLYKHLDGKPAVEAALVAAALAEVDVVLHHAVAAAGGGPGLAAVGALFDAYRSYVLANPNLYRLATAGELRRDRLPPGLEDRAGEPFLLATGDPHRAQALWALAHGMLVLEIDGRFPPGSDLGPTWAAATELFGAAARPAGAP